MWFKLWNIFQFQSLYFSFQFCFGFQISFYHRWQCASLMTVLRCQANGETELSSAVARNYTVDSRHLVLLHNFSVTGLCPVWLYVIETMGCVKTVDSLMHRLWAGSTESISWRSHLLIKLLKGVLRDATVKIQYLNDGGNERQNGNITWGMNVAMWEVLLVRECEEIFCIAGSMR